MLNGVANTPHVRRWLRGDGELDLSPVVADPANITLVGDGGGFILVGQGGGDYEAHSIIKRGYRHAVEDMQAAIEYAFVRTDCVRITTKAVDGNPHAAALSAAGGFVPLFHNVVQGHACLELTLDRWVAANPALEATGEWFHRRIDDTKLGLVEHPADPQHDRAAGAAVAMALAGNLTKCAWFYNRWAAHAGYPGVGIVTAHPPIIDTGEGVWIEVRDGDLEVHKCL